MMTNFPRLRKKGIRHNSCTWLIPHQTPQSIIHNKTNILRVVQPAMVLWWKHSLLFFNGYDKLKAKKIHLYLQMKLENYHAHKIKTFWIARTFACKLIFQICLYGGKESKQIRRNVVPCLLKLRTLTLVPTCQPLQFFMSHQKWLNFKKFWNIYPGKRGKSQVAGW